MSYQPGDVLKDKYLIKEKIGKGMMGEVYHAEHLALHKEVAIKLMHVHVEEDPQSLARFRREANSAAKLEHPHICQVSDFDTFSDGKFFIVMEYLQGETLRNRLKREGRLDINSVFRIMYEILDALDCAHANGIVHRDIKPDNIFLKKLEDRDDFVKLIDFGIAHADFPDDDSGSITQNGRIYGTPQYLSPEQVLGETVDHRADLYACGCTLFEMLEGVPPFHAEKYIVLLNEHLALDPPHLTSDEECMKGLDAIIQKLLQKSPPDRFSSAAEVSEALFELESNSPSLSVREPVKSSERRAIVGALPVNSVTSRVSKSGLKEIESHTDGDYRVGIKLSPIAVSRGIIIVVLAAAIINMFWHQKQIRNQLGNEPVTQNTNQQTADQKVQKNNIQTVNQGLDASVNTMDNLFVLNDKQIREYVKTECRVSADQALSGNVNIRTASESCLLGDYEDSLAILEKEKNNYINNSHFVLMMFIQEYMLQRHDDVIRDLMHLISMDPANVCIPMVRDVVYAMFEGDATYDRLQTAFKVIDHSQAKESLAWLILMSPCNQYRKRFERLYECFEAIGPDDGIRWLNKSVLVWGPYKESGSCDNRQRHVDTFVLDGLKSICTAPDVDNARCSVCYDIWRGRTDSSSSQ